MDPKSHAIFTIILFFVRIIITIYCTNKAGELNRSKFGWGMFGFFLPLVALIWIQFMKPIIAWEENIEIKNETKEPE